MTFSDFFLYFSGPGNGKGSTTHVYFVWLGYCGTGVLFLATSCLLYYTDAVPLIKLNIKFSVLLLLLMWKYGYGDVRGVAGEKAELLLLSVLLCGKGSAHSKVNIYKYII